jgi:hypothetical protein
MKAKIDNWFILCDGFVGEVTNHPRQAEFEKPQQWAFPSPKGVDLSQFKEGDTFVTDKGTEFVLGRRNDHTY